MEGPGQGTAKLAGWQEPRDAEEKPRGENHEEKPRGENHEEKPRGENHEEKPRGENHEEKPRGENQEAKAGRSEVYRWKDLVKELRSLLDGKNHEMQRRNHEVRTTRRNHEVRTTRCRGETTR